ncbi:MAG TPA: 16S rRNA (cytosine(1402)-N(4))-methyltransferase RsmH [Thermoanaerobaculaceae bacterium]|nr:16S rRNA (cytosine(1402)-N(4))-methyltransferase RsmH [Thermoanaerobaculaceae bacterium]
MRLPEHQPVLLEQVLEALAPPPCGLVVDATVGLGGHAAALLGRFPSVRVLGLDLDPEALAAAREKLARFGERVSLVVASYWGLAEVARAHGVATADGVLFDLGVSSLQLDTPARGFSFRHDAPLDMRFGPGGETAGELLAAIGEEELVRVLRDFGEEPRARRVARAIVRARAKRTLRTTTDLRSVVASALGPARGRIDPATRTFQALRIATNRELEGIPPALEQAVRLLGPGGRLAVIAFHSLEDRLVKRTFRRLAGRCVCPPGSFACTCHPERLLEVLTPRPVTPTDVEVALNPRARSAKLRVARRAS